MAPSMRPWIIPARAGFTLPQRRDRHHPRDHPRSRGVYEFPDLQAAWEAGSSPLARGLRRREARHNIPGRIIPARAGFTAPPARPRSGSQDHPRSRGVYEVRERIASLLVGSSPLARGLHVWVEDASDEAGIIPARAGFTFTTIRKED